MIEIPTFEICTLVQVVTASRDLIRLLRLNVQAPVRLVKAIMGYLKYQALGNGFLCTPTLVMFRLHLPRLSRRLFRLVLASIIKVQSPSIMVEHEADAKSSMDRQEAMACMAMVQLRIQINSRGLGMISTLKHWRGKVTVNTVLALVRGEGSGL